MREPDKDSDPKRDKVTRRSSMRGQDAIETIERPVMTDGPLEMRRNYATGKRNRAIKTTYVSPCCGGTTSISYSKLTTSKSHRVALQNHSQTEHRGFPASVIRIDSTEQQISAAILAWSCEIPRKAGFAARLREAAIQPPLEAVVVENPDPYSAIDGDHLACRIPTVVTLMVRVIIRVIASSVAARTVLHLFNNSLRLFCPLEMTMLYRMLPGALFAVGSASPTWALGKEVLTRDRSRLCGSNHFIVHSGIFLTRAATIWNE
ncbi:hypothetical protein E6O75_ATG01712 [Venturia nashicola]|uniref:Uncharacterized protein n=1 Tax=Venturia nashicola TaxID=86259 RepID=A0A4Z1NYG8_9PEZI|nr:hypothetical protein E6O75_ATG01712 [Venturia nashicola]